ncbi:hypothetical protein [Aquimonas voraii]|uniref:Uncharacterized protein n=1 Tax=Aquimonas voraii TaxID=265719 RepID=A0A1G6WNS7_9GAMM|nr:hypothetical protein [Aquimonas voraii]SDD66867.1 hypothetical protein SAMN04488509_10568 [Aquimonas voraii]
MNSSSASATPRAVAANLDPGCARAERIARRPYRLLLLHTLEATFVAVAVGSAAVSACLALIFALGSDAAVSLADLAAYPLLVLAVAFVASFIGGPPALLLCAPLWAWLLRHREADPLSFAVVGALPALALLLWDASLATLFLIYGVPVSLITYVLIQRLARTHRL